MERPERGAIIRVRQFAGGVCIRFNRQFPEQYVEREQLLGGCCLHRHFCPVARCCCFVVIVECDARAWWYTAIHGNSKRRFEHLRNMVAVLFNRLDFVDRSLHGAVVCLDATDRYGSRDECCGYDEVRYRYSGCESTRVV